MRLLTEQERVDWLHTLRHKEAEILAYFNKLPLSSNESVARKRKTCERDLKALENEIEYFSQHHAYIPRVD
jgi:hypothetical protein